MDDAFGTGCFGGVEHVPSAADIDANEVIHLAPFPDERGGMHDQLGALESTVERRPVGDVGECESCSGVRDPSLQGRVDIEADDLAALRDKPPAGGGAEESSTAGHRSPFPL